MFKLSFGPTKLMRTIINPVINWDRNNHDFLCPNILKIGTLRRSTNGAHKTFNE